MIDRMEVIESKLDSMISFHYSKSKTKISKERAKKGVSQLKFGQKGPPKRGLLNLEKQGWGAGIKK